MSAKLADLIWMQILGNEGARCRGTASRRLFSEPPRRIVLCGRTFCSKGGLRRSTRKAGAARLLRLLSGWLAGSLPAVSDGPLSSGDWIASSFLRRQCREERIAC